MHVVYHQSSQTHTDTCSEYDGHGASRAFKGKNWLLVELPMAQHNTHGLKTGEWAQGLPSLLLPSDAEPGGPPSACKQFISPPRPLLGLGAPKEDFLSFSPSTQS